MRFIITCPECASEDVEIVYVPMHHKYIGSDVEVSVICNNCGYEEAVD